MTLSQAHLNNPVSPWIIGLAEYSRKMPNSYLNELLFLIGRISASSGLNEAIGVTLPPSGCLVLLKHIPVLNNQPLILTGWTWISSSG